MLSSQLAKLILISSLPISELRGSIPLGITVYQLPWTTVFLVCVIANILIGIVVFLLLERIVALLNHIPAIARLYERFVIRTQKKVHDEVEKYGEIGLAIFIGVPLPGTGVYSGAIGANLLGFSFREFLIADILGVLIAGSIVTIITMGASQLWHLVI